METLAYLHLAQEYECPDDRQWQLPNSLSDPLSDRLLLTLLGILSTIGSLSFAQTAQALILQRHDCGSEVTRLQDLLRDAGYFPRSSTGFFGEVTEAAVEDFQRAKGLTIDGIAGDHTLNALGTRPTTPTPIAPRPPVAPVTPTTPVIPAVPPVSSSGATLGFGDSGAGVTRLQDLLRRAGYLSGPSTGFFGSATREALIRFQEANRLRADGFAGQSVIAALESAPAAAIAQSAVANPATPLIVTPLVATTPTAPTTATATAPTRTLMIGDGGEDVRSLQRQLTDLRYYAGPITGDFGELTDAAVRRFQRDKNLPIDGMVGSRTVALLR